MNPLRSALLTDLYQLTMLHAYYVHGMTDTAVFELFVRRLPPQRNFLMAAGLEQALEYLEGLHFTEEELAWVRESPLFRAGWVAPPDDGFFDQSATFIGGIGDVDWTEEWTNWLLEADIQ